MIENSDSEQVERLNSRIAKLLAEVAALKRQAQRAPSIEDLAAMPMRCDCTKAFKDWPLSDQLISKARDTLAMRARPAVTSTDCGDAKS